MWRTRVLVGIVSLLVMGCGSDGGSPIPADYPDLSGAGGHAVVADVDVTSDGGIFHNIAGSWTLLLHSADDTVGFSILGVSSLRPQSFHTNLDPLIDVSLRDASFDGSTSDCELRSELYASGGGTITIDGATSAYVWGTVDVVVCSGTGDNPSATRALNVKFSARIEVSDGDPDANGPGCTGTPKSCGGQASQYSCDDVLGCYWQSGSCSGTPPSCSTLSSGNCWKIDGCDYATGDSYCSGYPTPCALITSDFDCGINHGCTWTPAVCTGTAHLCSNYSAQWECLSTEGCVWNED